MLRKPDFLGGQDKQRTGGVVNKRKQRQELSEE